VGRLNKQTVVIDVKVTKLERHISYLQASNIAQALVFDGNMYKEVSYSSETLVKSLDHSDKQTTETK